MRDLDYNRIEIYLNGLMSYEEKISFESELLSNKDLAQNFKLHSDLRIFLGQYDDFKDFSNVLSTTHKDFVEDYKEKAFPKTNFFNGNKLRIIYIAASVAAVILVFFIFLTKSITSKPTDQIFEEYYYTAEIIDFRNLDNDTISNFELCIDHYRAKKFSLSNQCFNSISSESNEYYFARFYYGIGLMEQKEINKALSVFNEIIKIKNHGFYTQSMWYSALCYIKIKKPENAKRALEELTLENNHFSKKAQLLLEEL